MPVTFDPSKGFGDGTVSLGSGGTIFSRWAFVGDSITNGSSASNFRYSYAPKTAAAFPSSMLRKDSFEVGKPGETSAWGVSVGVPSALAAGARSFVLLFGANDAAQGVTPTDFANNVRQMVAMIRIAGGSVIVCTPPPRGVGRPTGEVASIMAYRMAIVDSSARWGYTVAQVYEHLVDPATGYMAAAYDSGDAIHPNDLGHARISDALCRAIRAAHPTTTLPPASVLTSYNGVADGIAMASGWYEQPGGTGAIATSSQIADTTGILQGGGQWRQRVVSGASNRTLATSTGVRVPFSAGDNAIICGQIQVVDDSGTWQVDVAAGNSSVGFALNSGGVNRYSRLLRDQGWYDPASATWNYSIWEPVIGVGSLASGFDLWINQRVASGAAAKFRVGNVGVFNATALGIPVENLANDLVNLL